MNTLLLRLAGPMQSWGVQSRFTVRDTGLEPSKSGVMGLLCAALGRPRDAPLEDLAALRMGVRCDHEGRLRRDYHTAGGDRRPHGYGVAKADGKGAPETVVSERYYLADADFLVGLDGPHALLVEIDAALQRPRWALYLGRKTFVPGTPVRVGLYESPLDAILAAFPWIARMPAEAAQKRAACRRGEVLRLRLVLDAPVGTDADVRWDVPLSFADGARDFRRRHVSITYTTLVESMITEPDHVPVPPAPQPS